MAKDKKSAKSMKEEPKKGKKPKFDVMGMYSESMDEIAKRQGYESSSLEVSPPISSGFLCVDLVYGGGIRPSMITAAADEQAGKTTLALCSMAQAIKENIPIIAMADYEGSTKNSKPYVQSILKTMGVNMTVDEVFGKKASDGSWKIRPRVRYRAEVILENFYTWLSEILRELPDKKYVEGKWWLVFDEKNKKHKAKVADFIDISMTRKYGNGLWVEAPDDKIQGLVFVDSYTAMNPKVKDEEEISNQLSVKASAFSKQLERIKGRMAEKMVTVYGLNHLRDNPMAMFGPKQDEKGGKALKQFSDVRLRQTSRSLSAAPIKGGKSNKQFNEIEKSVEFPGKIDEYRYIHVKAVKNKLWTPQRQTFFRIWIEDGKKNARGIDPVFDTIFYLKETGQLKGNRKSGWTLDIPELGKSKSKFLWDDLKLWVLGDKEAMTKLSKKAGYQPMSLRAFCFKQMKSGRGEELYVECQSSKTEGDGDDE